MRSSRSSGGGGVGVTKVDFLSGERMWQTNIFDKSKTTRTVGYEGTIPIRQVIYVSRSLRDDKAVSPLCAQYKLNYAEYISIPISVCVCGGANNI